MIRLLCRGEYLDLYENTSIQFTHDNPLFAFDKMSCERTTQFKLPCTPTNDRVFALARIPAYMGEGMRRKFDAQLQMSGIVQNGYLYVTSFDGKDYNSIFVTGELVGLQQISQLGKISEIMNYDDVVTLGVGSYSPQAAADRIWENVAYKKPTAELLIPSIGLKQLYETIAEEYGLNVQAFPEELNGFRIVPAEAKGVDEIQHFICTKNPDGGNQPFANASQLTETYNLLDCDDRLFDTADVIIPVTELDLDKYFKIRKFVVKTPLTLTFPDDWDDRYYVYKFEDWDGGIAPASQYFYGDRYFERPVNSSRPTRHGESLRGRSIEFAAGDAFGFVCEDDYVNVSAGGTDSYGFFFNREAGDFFKDYAVKVTTSDLVSGNICRLQDNLPDCTFVELCKTMAAIMGKVLNYSDSGYTNIMTKLPIVSPIDSGVYDASTCTFTSTRTQNTNPSFNGLFVSEYYNNIVYQRIKTQYELGAGYVTFTKTSNFNRLCIEFNGNRKAAWIFFDASSLTNGKSYTLYYDVTILDRTNTGNDAQVSNLCLVEGDEVVSWDEWKNNQLGLSFEDLDFDTFNRIESSEILKRGEVKRTFGDYQKKNIIRFSSNEIVTNRLSCVYTIDNDNLKDENVLQEIPFSEGDVLDNALYIHGDNSKPTIGGMTDGNSLLTRVSLLKNGGLQSLCTASTQFKVDTRTSSLEYFHITPKTLLLVEGTLYTWTSRQWQADKASFTLAKLP